jgi:hypothetical protein
MKAQIYISLVWKAIEGKEASYVNSEPKTD